MKDKLSINDEGKRRRRRKRRPSDSPGDAGGGQANGGFHPDLDVNEIELDAIRVDPAEMPESSPGGPFRKPNFFSGLAEAANLFFGSHSKELKRTLIGIIAVGFHIYLGIAIAHNLHNAIALLVLTLLFWTGMLYYKVLLPYFGGTAYEMIYVPIESNLKWLTENKIVRWLFALCVLIAIALFLYFETRDNRWRLVSFAGLIFYLLILFIFSKSPTKVRWRPVFWGIFLQFLMGVLVLKWLSNGLAINLPFLLPIQQTGRWILMRGWDRFKRTVFRTNFVYGFLVTPPNICGLAPVFAFSALQTILYLGAVIGILYHLGVMQFIVMRMAWIMQFTMGTTGPESLSAAASIFLGTIESPLAIRPYMIKLTESEWFAIMTAGLSTIAGSVFAIYISFGACPVHLLAASFMSAPASLAVAKLFFPETKESKLKKVADLKLAKGEENNVIEAAVNGASAAMEIVFNVIATLIVFLALLAFFNNVLLWLGAMVGVEGLSFEKLLSWIFFPLAFMMGASDLPDPAARNADLLKVAELMGIKVTLNEFIAYQRLGKYIADRTISKRATVVATYALCGFSNIGAMGMALGGLGTLCPERKGVLARIAVRALIASNIACFMTACMAGLLSADMEFCGKASNETASSCFVIP